MPTRIVRTHEREYEVARVGEVEKVFCRELRLLEPGPELEAVRRQMETEDEHRRKEAEAKKAPERSTPEAPKHRKQRRGKKRRHR